MNTLSKIVAFVYMTALAVAAGQEAGVGIGIISAGDGSGDGGMQLWAPTLHVQGSAEGKLFGTDSAGSVLSVLCAPTVDAVSQATTRLPRGLTRPNRAYFPASVTLHTPENVAARICGFVEFLPKNSWVSFPADTGSVARGGSLLPRRLVGTELSVSLSNPRLDVSGVLQLNRLRYDFRSSRIDDETVLFEKHDDNLWMLGDAAAWFFERRVAIVAGGLVKDDFNTWGGSNIADVRGGLATDLRPIKNKLMISGTCAGRFVASTAMSRKGYQVGPGALLDFRVVNVPFPMTYLKLSGSLQAGSRSTKQQYALSFKKVVKKFSAEGGYAATLGTLFPRMNTFVKSSVGLGTHVAVEPGVRTYWDYRAANENFAYSRFDGLIGLRFMPKTEGNALLRNMTVSGGAIYQWFPAPPSALSVRDWRAPSLELSLGIDTWL